MKKLISSLLLTVLVLGSFVNGHATIIPQQIKKNTEWDGFYNFLKSRIKYPEKAKLNDLQGNSIISFTLTTGKINNIKIAAELGSGCDIIVLNNILAYSNFKAIKDGNYALKTAYRITGSNSTIHNQDVKVPNGYTELNFAVVANTKVAYNDLVKPMGETNKSSIIIRENSRVNTENGNSPIIVLNDTVVENESLNGINPDHIKNITILKDATGIAKYGDKARNGVIVVTTKDMPVKGIEIRNNEPLYIIDGKEISSGNLKDIDPSTIKDLSVLKDATRTKSYGDRARNGVIIVTTKDAPVKEIEIRNNEPLYIIDGKEVSSGKLKDIDPSTIKDVSILKDATRTKSYGDRARNGVIIVTTKDAVVKKVEGVEIQKLESDGTQDETTKAKIMIRGNQVYTGKGGDPLVLLNEEPTKLDEISAMKQEDIQKISVLGTQKAMLLYGVEAKNGAILITTKKPALQEEVKKPKQ